MANKTKFTVFLNKWAKVYIKADMSEWSNVLDAFEGDYKARARADENFRLEFERSDALLDELLMNVVKQLK